MAIDLQDNKIAIGSTDYPAEHNAMIDDIQSWINAIGQGYQLQGELDASAGSYPASPSINDAWVISVAGTISGISYSVGEVIVYSGSGWIDVTQLAVSGNVSINSGTIDGTIIGGTTPAAGSFTTLGANGDLTFSNSNPIIVGADVDGGLYISGGSGSGSGANMILFGESHATVSNDIRFRNGATVVGQYDSSETRWNFQDNDIATTGNVGIGTTPSYTLHTVTAATTGIGNRFVANSVTSGDAVQIDTNNASFSGDLLFSFVNNASASGTAARFRNDGTGNGVLIDQNGNGTAINVDSESASATTVKIASEQTSAPVVEIVNNGIHANTGNASSLFVRQVQATTDAPVIRVENDGAGIGLFIDQNGDGTALEIDTEALTSYGLYVNANVLTTGNGIYAYTNSPNFSSSGGFLRVIVENASASGNAANIRNDGSGDTLILDNNGSGTALNIDSEATTQTVINASAPTSQVMLWLTNEHASNPNGMYIDFSAASPDDNTQYFFRFDDSTTARAYCYSDGDFANHDGTYGTISDRFYKTDIVEARDYWDDWKAVQFHTFTKGGKKQFGVIADEMEQVFPGLVHTSPDENHPDGESQWVDTMNLNHIGGKVLQEALKRIEALEAEIAALKGA